MSYAGLAEKGLLSETFGTAAWPTNQNGEFALGEAAMYLNGSWATQTPAWLSTSVNELGWEDMQLLVAGILRAMGYKTEISPPGADRGKDIVASPDGFGFEHPRIVVEVKHRKGQMGSQEICSFLGGRHKDDRGLYVSTGGFTKDAQYEADRAAIPLQLWTLDRLVRALIEHYPATDAETKRIVPLKRLYWPA